MKYIVALLFGLNAILNADQLALVKINPDQIARLNLSVYHEFTDELIMRINPEIEARIINRTGQIKILDEHVKPDQYYLVYKVGTGKDRYPGKFLWENEQIALVSMSGPEAIKSKSDGFISRKLREHPLLKTEPADELYIPHHDSLIGQMVQSVSLDSLVAILYHLQNYGTRYTYSRKCDTAAWWIHDKLQAYNLPVVYDVYLAGTQRDTSYNVIATLTGQVRPESIVIICGHFDSYSNVPYTSAPGADDNATGTAVVLEAARILSRYRFRWTIKFVGFSGEEQWMLGSYHYVDSVAVPQQLKIGGVFNFDMIAYTAYDSTRMYVNRNTASTALAVLAESVNVQYNIGLNLINYLDEDCAGDNTPFWEHGYKSVFALEDTEWGIWNGSNPHYHTTHDTVGICRLGQVLRGAKLGVACVAAMAGPNGLNMIEEEPSVSKETRSFIPSIVQNNIILPENRYAQLFDISGKKVGHLRSGNNNIKHLSTGIYFIKTDNNKYLTKIIIQQ
jgi:hypothetical protein